MDKLRDYFITQNKEFNEGDVFVFSQKFNIENIEKAKLAITALGVYEAEINGQKVGKQMFAPGFTYYPKRVLFQEHDVKTLLINGENELRVYLGQGWYCGRFLCENETQIYGKKQGVSWILNLDDNEFISDENVDILESPYTYAGEYDGEVYTAKKDLKVIGKAVKYDEFIPEIIEKTTMEVRVQEELPIKKISNFNDKTIIDFGQNFAGIIEINPAFVKDETITIRHGEVLNLDGSLYTNNLRKAKATIVYNKGDEKKIYRPRFTYMGFRFIEITGEYTEGLIKAFALYTDMERTGYFESGNENVTKLFNNQVWGQKSNYVEVPTDCPQRDERMGYTGDGQVFAKTGAYNFNTLSFWQNFFNDAKLGQDDNSEGYIGATVPPKGKTGIGFISMLGWGNAITIIPETLYKLYGDESILTRQYESMKTFVECEIRKMAGQNLWFGASLGDWLAYGKDVPWTAMHNNPISNSFIVNDLRVITNVAKMLGKDEDALRYCTQYEKTKKAYIQAFVKEDGIVEEDYQSAYVMALQYVITEPEMRSKVISKFVDNVKRNGLETGFFATEFLLALLVEAGEAKLAYDILLSEGMPSWMYQIKLGATTTWERWDAIKLDGSVNEDVISNDNMVSFNHYAFGSVGEFYYEYILGIKPLEPGFKKTKIQPVIDPRLAYAKGSYNSVNGIISVEWKYLKDEISFEIEVPTEALIILPDGIEREVEKGKYKYTIGVNKNV